MICLALSSCISCLVVSVLVLVLSFLPSPYLVFRCLVVIVLYCRCLVLSCVVLIACVVVVFPFLYAFVFLVVVVLS